MDFRPASFKVHIVYIRFHQLDAASTLGSRVRWDAVTEYLSEVESFSLIRHDDWYFVARSAAAPDVYFSLWIFLIAMHDCVVQPSRSASSTSGSAPGMHCDPSMSRIKRSTRGEMA